MYALSRHGLRELFSLSRLDSSCIFLYSTSTTAAKDEFMVNYLVDSLGFSKEQAISVSTKVRPLNLIPAKKFDSVLNLYKQYGLDETHIRKMIFLDPKVLFCQDCKTLEIKFKFLQDLGLSGPDLIKLVTVNPSVLARSMDSHFIPCINYLKSVLGSDTNVVKVIHKNRFLLSFNVRKKMQPNLDFIRAKGFPDQKIPTFVMRNPSKVIKDPKLFKGSVQRVEDEMGIPCKSGMFIDGFSVLCSVSKSSSEMKFGVYRSFVWSDSQLSILFRKQPNCLRLSEAKIRKGLNYFMSQLGLTPADLVQNPTLLMYSLEKRVMPRYEALKILKERGIKVASLQWVVHLSELDFVEKYVQPYKDEIPNLYEAYSGKKGEPVEIS